ncbi:hypothetical protein [Profundibacter sp.]
MTVDDTDVKALKSVEKPHGFKTTMLVLSLVLPVIGLALTYFYPLNSYQYWGGLLMVASMGVAAFYASHAHRMGFFEEIILVLAFLLSLIGIGLTNYSPTSSVRFWMAMTLFMAVAAIVIGAVKSIERKDMAADMIVTQLIHWGAHVACGSRGLSTA